MNGVAEFRSIVIDCPDPRALADFYSRLLGWPVAFDEDDWVVVTEIGSPMRLAFQRAENHQPPVWPSRERPQQLHIDTVTPPLPEESGFSLPFAEVGDGQALPVSNTKTISGKRFPRRVNPAVPSLDSMVDDLDKAEEQVLRIGATKAETQPSEDGGFRVFLDPAGHPFCLIAKD